MELIFFFFIFNMDINKINNYCKDPYKKTLVRKKKYHYGDVEKEHLLKSRYKWFKPKPPPQVKEEEVFDGLKKGKKSNQNK
jgi:hypothetical protein